MASWVEAGRKSVAPSARVSPQAPGSAHFSSGHFTAACSFPLWQAEETQDEERCPLAPRSPG